MRGIVSMTTQAVLSFNITMIFVLLYLVCIWSKWSLIRTVAHLSSFLGGGGGVVGNVLALWGSITLSQERESVMNGPL